MRRDRLDDAPATSVAGRGIARIAPKAPGERLTAPRAGASSPARRPWREDVDDAMKRCVQSSEAPPRGQAPARRGDRRAMRDIAKIERLA